MRSDEDKKMEKSIDNESYLYRDKVYNFLTEIDKRHFNVIDFPEGKCINKHMADLGYMNFLNLGSSYIYSVELWGGTKASHHRIIAHVSFNDYGFTEIYFEQTCDFIHWMNNELKWVDIIMNQDKMEHEWHVESLNFRI